MTIAQAWLPEKCLADPRLAQPVVQLVRAWCAHWFAAPAWIAGDHWVRKLAQSDDKASPVFELDNGIACLLADRGKIHLAAAMLGLPLDKGVPAKADGQLISAIADKALADLAERIDSLGLANPVRDGATNYIPVDWPTYRLAIFNKARQPMLMLDANRQVLVALAWAQAPSPRTGPALFARETVIEHMPVRIGAKIGAARLSLTELQGLGVGDVIALDRPVDSRFGLTVDGCEKLAAAFVVTPEQETLQLQLMRSIS